jgi:hypothetical protein
VSQATVAPDLDKPLDVEIDLSSQVALNHVVSLDMIAQMRDLFLSEVPHSHLGSQTHHPHGFPGSRTTNPVDIGECDLNLFLVGYVNASDSRQSLRSSV